jgi:uncharacterized protein YndB with AHSA1/START domain
MDIILTILGILAGIIVLLLVLALIAPKAYTIQRSIVINKPVHRVFEYVKYLRNQDNYSKWVMTDPNKRMTYRGTDGTVGYASAWDSDVKQAGKGEQTIEKIIEDERIDIRVVFIKPFAGVADTYIATQAVTDNATAVKWSFNGKMAYPMNLMLLFINMDKMLGADMDESLGNLKRILEKQ